VSGIRSIGVAMNTLGSPAYLDQALLAAPREQANRQFIAAWLGWRGAGRNLPKRSAVELEDIKHLLGRVVLLEIISGDDIRIKVAGSQLREHANFEATGKNFADITPPEQWPTRRWHLTEMATRPCGGALITRDTQTLTGEGVSFEAVTLPVEPERPAGPRLLMSNVAVLGGIYEPAAKHRPQIIRLADEFRFLDLGAGIPNHVEP
jgi:hypothetical protein